MRLETRVNETVLSKEQIQSCKALRGFVLEYHTLITDASERYFRQAEKLDVKRPGDNISGARIITMVDLYICYSKDIITALGKVSSCSEGLYQSTKVNSFIPIKEKSDGLITFYKGKISELLEQREKWRLLEEEVFGKRNLQNRHIFDELYNFSYNNLLEDIEKVMRTHKPKSALSRIPVLNYFLK